MARRSYLPAADAAFGQWLDNFITVATPQATDLGLSPDDLVALGTALTGWTGAYAARLTTRTAGLAASATKRQARVDATAVIRPLVRRIQANPLVTDTMRADLQLTLLNAPRAGEPVLTAPEMKLDFGQRGRMVVHVGRYPGNERINGLPEGVAGVVLQYADGEVDEAQRTWQWLPTVTASPFVHVVETSVPRALVYRAAYITGKKTQGPWSAAVSGTVSP